MSLVAYGSSDDSDTEDPSLAGRGSGLFAGLPTPKNSQNLSKDSEHRHVDGSRLSPSRELLLNLPKSRKRTEPVKISIPEIQRGDSDSDEDEPATKKGAGQGSGGGSLTSLLPQPRNMVLKETQRPLVPHSLTKRPQESKPAGRPAGPAPSASPSAIKAAAKSAALQLARQMAQEDEGSDEELAPENYFSLGESVPPEPYPAASLPPPPGTDASFQPDPPVDFGLAPPTSWEGEQQYSEPAGQTFPQEYYTSGYYENPSPAETQAEEPTASSLFDDEAFRRLQGKRNRGKEEIKFLDIKGDDQLSGTQQWLTKNMTEEKEQRKSFSKKKGDQPTSQQRRKHQITYLIHQAKERELELKNTWAENKLTRRQTQAKYGF